MKKTGGIIAVLLSVLTAGCTSVDDDRIPSMPVSINLSDAGMWNSYGVSGFGVWREFIRELNVPSPGFFTANTYTGYGGVLLIGGMDPFNANTDTPLAYDLSCPVERKRDIRVAIDGETLEAVCPVCHSHYDVVMQGGTSISGPAYSNRPRFALRRYECLQSSMGGYFIR